MIELRVSDLKFTPSETLEFLKGRMNLNLSMHDMAALEKPTEGWLTGLQ